jgi:hypothetical protein
VGNGIGQGFFGLFGFFGHAGADVAFGTIVNLAGAACNGYNFYPSRIRHIYLTRMDP